MPHAHVAVPDPLRDGLQVKVLSLFFSLFLFVALQSPLLFLPPSVFSATVFRPYRRVADKTGLPPRLIDGISFDEVFPLELCNSFEPLRVSRSSWVLSG